MTQSFAITADTRDMYKDGGKNLVMVSGVDAIAQNCSTAMRAQKGEMQYNMQGGMPMMATAFNQYDPIAFEAAARKVLRGVDGVTGIAAFNVTRSTNTLNYTATVNTIFGSVQISG